MDHRYNISCLLSLFLKWRWKHTASHVCLTTSFSYVSYICDTYASVFKPQPVSFYLVTSELSTTVPVCRSLVFDLGNNFVKRIRIFGKQVIRLEQEKWKLFRNSEKSAHWKVKESTVSPICILTDFWKTQLVSCKLWSINFVKTQTHVVLVKMECQTAIDSDRLTWVDTDSTESTQVDTSYKQSH